MTAADTRAAGQRLVKAALASADAFVSVGVVLGNREIDYRARADALRAAAADLDAALPDPREDLLPTRSEVARNATTLGFLAGVVVGLALALIGVVLFAGPAHAQTLGSHEHRHHGHGHGRVHHRPTPTPGVIRITPHCNPLTGRCAL